MYVGPQPPPTFAKLEADLHPSAVARSTTVQQHNDEAATFTFAAMFDTHVILDTTYLLHDATHVSESCFPKLEDARCSQLILVYRVCVCVCFNACFLRTAEGLLQLVPVNRIKLNNNFNRRGHVACNYER